ncbi:MAG: tyrosine-type recombinase/integrase [Acidaminococcaceae bacterium]|nr:tyrosine-type recombinase/integrase [Acidaminococcaceae bacterium]
MAKQQQSLNLKYISYERSRRKFVVEVPMPDGSRPKRRFATREAAIAYRDDICSIIQGGRLALNPEILVKEWVGIWLERYCGDLSEKTRQSYAQLFRTHCKSIHNLRMVGEVKAFHITNLLEDMKRKKLSYNTMARTYAMLRSCFNRVHNEQLIVYDVIPTTGCRIPKRKRVGKTSLVTTSPRTAYSVSVLDSLVQAARTIDKRKNVRARWTCLILLLRVTGMRLSECLGICKSDVTFTEDTAVIDLHHGVHDVDKKQSVQGQCWAVEDLKSEASYRKLVIHDKELITLLKMFLALEHPLVEYAGVQYNFLFATKSGTPILHSAFSKMFKKIRASAGSPIRVHEIRHSVATILGADSGIPFANSAKYLGHTKEVFIKHYVHAQEESEDKISLKLTPKSSGSIQEEARLYIARPSFAPKFAPTKVLRVVS